MSDMKIREIVSKFNAEITNLDNIKSKFCVHPEKDFTRNRKITFVSTIKSILAFGGGTLTNELLRLNKISVDTPTSS